MTYDIMIAGDTVPTKKNSRLFESGSTAELVDTHIAELFAGAKQLIFNLETPFTTSDRRIAKCGPHLKASPASMRGIAALGKTPSGAVPMLVTLANNHITDCGKEGLDETMRLLDEHGIAHIGAGTPSDAEKPAFIDVNGCKIGVFAVAEHEFSAAADNGFGANTFDPLETPDGIAALKALCDRVIVLYHGGTELYRYPTPELQRRLHALARRGADLIICQHSHCIGCMEEYSGCTIVYGQGDFLFHSTDVEERQTGLLIGVNVDKSGIHTDFIPVKRSEYGVECDPAPASLDDFTARSEEIKNHDAVMRRFDALCAERQSGGLWLLTGRRSLLFRAINRLSGYKLLKSRYTGSARTAALSALRCEAHNELLTGILKRENT